MKENLFISICVGSALCATLVSCDSKPQPMRVSTIKLQATTLTLEVGEKRILTATVLPMNAENKAVSWKSDDESIAEVSSLGEVTPIAAGTTTITAITADGEKTASCTVTVTVEEEDEQNEEQKDLEEEVKGIQPVPVSEISDEIVTFFENHLPVFSGGKSDCFFVNDKENKSLMINSIDEFKKIISSIELPTINFDTYTLIVGQYWTHGGGFYVSSQRMTIESSRVNLNLIVKRREGAYPAVAIPRPLYCWGLYPKLSEKSIINITVTYEN
ncbi:MAG: Ig-like domain-containing protein [Tannerellaceae bacterium]|jgi:hypothetical protein|nr:Ig-like domain-containing protein [Tannerellaceae bacterium]